MLIGRRLNDYQNAVGTPFGRWDANTWADSLRSDFSPRITAPYVGVRCRMNPIRFFAKEFTKAKYKYLNKAIIENIDTDLFNEILEQLLGNGWVKLYEYDAIDAWIDFGKVKIRKDNTTLVFEWDNYMEGVIIGSKYEIEQVAKQFRLQSSSVPSYINENA